MINQQEITQEWLEQVSRANQKADKILIEKVIRALLLLEGLVKQKLPFVFKGGTALMLHFDSTKRLSIDIDIILPQSIEYLDEILKEVVKEQNFLRYDIGNLFDRVSDIEIVKTTFCHFAETELAYRNLFGYTDGEVLADTYQTALCIVSRGKDGVGNFEELQKVIQRIAGFIFSEKYHIEKVILHASKVAYLAMLIKNKAQRIEKFIHSTDMSSWNMGNSPLNKLKKSNQEAFFYWYKIHELSKI